MSLTSNQPKNILYISSSSSIGGGEVYLLSVMRHLDRKLYNPIVLLPGDGVEFRAALNELDVHSIVMKLNCGWLKPDRAWYNFLSEISNRIDKIGDVIEKYNIDLIHTNSNIVPNYYKVNYYSNKIKMLIWLNFPILLFYINY